MIMFQEIFPERGFELPTINLESTCVTQNCQCA